MKTRYFSLLACLLALCLSMSAAADSAPADPMDQVQALADGIITYELTSSGAADMQSWLDGALSDSAGTGTEWYVLALSQRSKWNFTAYREALQGYLASASVPSASTRLKYALILAATGSTDGYITATLAEAAGQQGIMSHIYALHLMNNGVSTPDVTAEDTLTMLLSLQYEDGGWALYGAASDPDVTAMALQALAPHQDGAAVRTAIDRGLSRLSALQRTDGDYASFGTPNPETTAQVLIALSELGIDGLTDERFIKDGHTLLDGLARYRLPDGSFSHRLGDPSSENATMQVFLALTAYQRLLSGQPGLYALDHRAEDIFPILYPVSLNATPSFSYKPIAAAVIATLSLLAMLLLLFMKKANRKNLTAVLVIAAVLIGLVFVTDIQPADSYYSGQLSDKPDAVGTVTLSIRCDRAIGHPGAAHVPADGVILAPTAIPIAEGDTVFTVLTEVAQAFGIHLESSGGAGMRYLSGIANLYEFGCGDLSGWLYAVNGKTPSVGCDQYILADGDVVEWAYSLDMGGDLGFR